MKVYWTVLVSRDRQAFVNMNTACSIKIFKHRIEQLWNQPKKIKSKYKKKISGVKKTPIFFIKTRSFHMNKKERSESTKRFLFISSPLTFRRTNSLQVGCGIDIGGIILINTEH